jgi:hypothetical protein
MNSRLKIAVVIVVASAAAFASSMVIWPSPAGFTPPPSLMPFFVGLGFVESLAFGAGVAFLIFGWRLVRETGVSRFAAWGGYLGIAWSLVNWWAHDGFHRVTGLNYEGLVRIEYGFHVTLIAGGVLAAFFFVSVARVASRTSDLAPVERHRGAELAPDGVNS